jgi:hypothetical protein
MPTRGSRPITVDAVRYRWRVRSEGTYRQNNAWNGLTASVELADEPGRVLVVSSTARAQTAGWAGKSTWRCPARLPTRFGGRSRWGLKRGLQAGLTQPAGGQPNTDGITVENRGVEPYAPSAPTRGKRVHYVRVHR